MSLPSTGQIKASDINIELGRTSTLQYSFQQAESGIYVPINTASTIRPNGAAPNSISEWRGYNHTAAVTYDTDAQAFFAAANITNTAQKNAVNSFVLTIKDLDMWNGMRAIYVFVGGTASQHSYNLKNPAQYQITWVNSPTHSANGVQFLNTSNQYGNTGLNPNTIGLLATSQHVAFWDRTGAVGDANPNTPIGCVSGAGAPQRLRFAMYGSTSSYNTIADLMTANNTATRLTVNGSTSQATGLNVLTSFASPTTKVTWYKNGSLLASTTTALSNTTPVNANVLVGACGKDTTPFYELPSNKQISFASIGLGIAPALHANFYAAVNTLQTALGR